MLPGRQERTSNFRMPSPQVHGLHGLFRIALVLLVLALHRPAAAAQDEAPKPAADEHNLTDSARLPRSRAGEALLARARDFLARGSVEEGLAAVQALLNAPDPRFVDYGSHAVLLAAEADRLLNQLSPDELAVYERQFGPAARRALEQARATGKREQLIQVVVQYRHTAAGIEALRELAAGYFDRAAFSAAARVYRSLLDHPLVQFQDEAPAVAKLILATALAGDAETARQLLKRHRGWLDERRLSSHAERPRLGDWLESTLAAKSPGAAHADSTSDETSATSSADHASTVTIPGDMPSMRAVWTYAAGADSNLLALAESGLAELDLQGVPQLPGFTPLAVGDLVIARTLDSLLALDAVTGTLHWRQASGIWPAPADHHAQLFENSAFREMAADTIMRQIQVDSVLGRITSDGQRVFVVELADAASSGGTEDGAPTPLADNRTTRNCLAAYDVLTGKRLWRTGVPPRDQTLSDVFFLGPPTALEGALYAVGQQDADIRLYAIDPARGTRQWSRLLAVASRDLSAEPARREFGCPIAIADGIAVCPTAAGAIVAVDLSTRRPLWAYRYEHEGGSPAGPRVRGRLNRTPRYLWWQNWRETGIAVANEVIVFGSPESDILHAIGLNDGKLRWKRPRDGGLYFAGVSQGKALMIARDAIHAFDLETGNTAWTAQTGRIAAPGFAGETHYFVPLRSGGVAAVQLANGAVECNVPAANDAPGRLVQRAGGVISQDHERIRFYPHLNLAWSKARQHLAQSPDGDEATADALYALALLAREAGDYGAARKRLAELAAQPTLAERAAALQRDTLLEELRRWPDRRVRIAEDIAPLLSRPEHRIRWRHAKARAAGHDGNPLEALSAYLELLELNPTGEISVEQPPRRTVRFDRLIQGEMLDLLGRVADSEFPIEAAGSPAAARLFAQRIEKARNSEEPFAFERCTHQLSHLPWGEELRVELAAQSGHGVGFLNAELELLQLAESRNRSRAAWAVWELARLLDSRSEQFAAAAAYRRLRDAFPEVVVAGDDNGRTATQLVEDLPANSPLANAVADGPREPWPDARPEVSRNDAGRRVPDLHPIPVVMVAESVLDRLDVFVDREGREVRFQGAGHRGYWELTLPSSRSPFRTAYNLHRGWGWGHLLILQVGAELFAIAPLDENGEPGAKILWKHNTHDEPTWDDYDIREDRLGFGLGDVVILDKFRRPIGQVGPVRAGYLCFRHKGTLTALETATGEMLWRRFDLPPDVVVGGDEHYVLLTRSDPHEVEVVRALDGKTLAVRPQSTSSTQRLFDQGRFRIVETVSEETYRLRKLDLVEDRAVWQSDFPPGTLPFAIDSQRFGLLGPDGALQFVSTDTGQVVATHSIKRPEKIAQIHTIRDPFRIFIVISGDLDADAANRLAHSRNHYRSPLVNGFVYAFDRQTNCLLWETALRNEAVPLDQPHSVPLFFTVRFDAGSPRDGSTLKCFDKRSGQLLHTNETHRDGMPLLLDAHPDLGRITLELASETVQFEFSP